MKRRLLEERDRLLAEIEALRNRVQGLEIAIALVDGEDIPREETRKARNSGTKGAILDLLMEAGTTGLNAANAIEIAGRRGQHLDRQSVSSLLSRLKRDKVVVYEDDRYKLIQFSKERGTGDTRVLKVVSPAT